MGISRVKRQIKHLVKLMKKLCLIGLICLGVLLCFVSCKRKPSKPPETPKPQISPGTLLFLDSSMSMRGYFRVSPNKGTTIQRFMLADLLEILAENCLTPVYLSSFGSNIGKPEEIKSLKKWSFFESQTELEEKTYSQKETNLIGVFQYEKFDRNTVSIIITDGIQSALEGSQNIAGFDRRIFSIIRDKTTAGIHLWLIGVKSKFRGIVYPERPSLEGRRKPFHYSGFRPVYIWIASHDTNIGHNLAGKIVAKLRSISGLSDSVKVACLTSVQPPRVNIKLNTDESSSHIVTKIINKDNSFEWLVARTKESEINIPIILEESVQSILDDVEWNINLELEPKNIKWAKLVQKDSDWLLNLTYDFISSKKNLVVIAYAIPRINPRPWWSQWSTEDDSRPENADKTLYLERLKSIIEEPLGKKYEVRRVSLRIKKPF